MILFFKEAEQTTELWSSHGQLDIWHLWKIIKTHNFVVSSIGFLLTCQKALELTLKLQFKQYSLSEGGGIDQIVVLLTISSTTHPVLLLFKAENTMGVVLDTILTT
jgi:hypothetical protein